VIYPIHLPTGWYSWLLLPFLFPFLFLNSPRLLYRFGPIQLS
jgi:hypothetical protein